MIRNYWIMAVFVVLHIRRVDQILRRVASVVEDRHYDISVHTHDT